MTISTTQSTELAATNVIKQAMQRARVLGAGQEPSGEDVEMGVGWLTTNLQDWQVADEMLRHRERGSLATTTSTGVYTTGLPAGLMKIYDPISVTLTSGTDAVAYKMSHSEYEELADKTFEAITSKVLVEYLSGGVKLRLWPVPSSQMTAIGFWYDRSLFDAGQGNTLDVKAQYQKAVIMQLAGDFSHHYRQPEFATQRLYGMYKEIRDRVRSDSGDDNDLTMTVPW